MLTGGLHDRAGAHQRRRCAVWDFCVLRRIACARRNAQAQNSPRVHHATLHSLVSMAVSSDTSDRRTVRALREAVRNSVHHITRNKTARASRAHWACPRKRHMKKFASVQNRSFGIRHSRRES